ncbi:MAG: DUF1659 domain-containing protein [Clostridiaceae bacterium]|nr:DUF1659 domain-containing protein [Clostridiaceae bacterium]
MVESTLVSNSIVIKYVSGVTSAGKDITKSQKFNSIRKDMTDAEIFAVGKAIMSLMVNNVVDFRKTLEYTLAEG